MSTPAISSNPISEPTSLTEVEKSSELSPPLSEEMSNSPFAKMFPGGATQEQLKAFIDNCLKMVIRDIRLADERWKKAQERLRKAAEGRNPFE